MRKPPSFVLLGWLPLWVWRVKRVERTQELRVLSSRRVQVNLMRKMRVTGVVTQGASRAGSAQYLKTFKVAYSLDGRDFQFIQGSGESGDKVRLVGTLKKGCGQCPLQPGHCLRAPSEGPNEARVPWVMGHEMGL